MDPLILTYGTSPDRVSPAGDPLADCQTELDNMRHLASLGERREEEAQSKARFLAGATGAAGLIAGYLIGRIV